MDYDILNIILRVVFIIAILCVTIPLIALVIGLIYVCFCMHWLIGMFVLGIMLLLVVELLNWL